MRALIAAFSLGCTLFIAPALLAQDTPTEVDSSEQRATADPSEERATQFVGVTGPDAERIPGGPLLLAAYAVVWALLFGFLWRMRGLQRQTADELERLTREIRASGER